MNHKEKEGVISSLARDFTRCEAAFVVSIKMSAQKTQILKKKLRNDGAYMLVAKNTLLRRAASRAPVMLPLLDYFKNQVALVFAHENAPAVAAIIKENGYGADISVHIGLLHGKVIDSSKFEFVATIPPLKVLQAQLCGVLKAPIARLAYILKTVAEREQ